MTNLENGQRKIEFKKGTIIVTGLIGLLAIAVLANRLYQDREEGIDTSREPQSLADFNETVVAPEVAESRAQPAGQLPPVPSEYPTGWWDCSHPIRSNVWDTLIADGVPVNTIQGRPIVIKIPGTDGEDTYIPALSLTDDIYLNIHDGYIACPLIETPQ